MLGVLIESDFADILYTQYTTGFEFYVRIALG